MEMIEVVALAHFTDTRVGSASRRQVLRLPLEVAEQLESIGLVQRTNPTAATASAPPSTAPQDVGGGESPASSPAAPASPSKTATLSQGKGGQPSPSTTLGDEHEALTFSTLATNSGGASTTKKSPKPSKASAGPKTKPPHGATASTASAARTSPASDGTA